MDIIIPKNFKVHNRTYNLGDAGVELQRENLEGSPSNHSLFVYMLKYLMSPMDGELSDISNSMKILLKPEVLEKASGYTHDMEVDAEEYKKHIKHAWEELSESVMHDNIETFDEEGKKLSNDDGTPATKEIGLLYILSNQSWVQPEEKKIINSMIRQMPESGKKAPFNDILDTVDATGKPQIGRIGQQKIMGYRKGQRSAKLFDAAGNKKPFYPILDILKNADVSTSANESTAKINNKVIIELKEHPKPKYIEDGLQVLDMKEITIHFDRAFAVLREEYGMPMKMERIGSAEIETMSNDNGTIEKEDLISSPDAGHIELDAEGLPKKQYGKGVLELDEYTTKLKDRYLNHFNHDIELSDEEKWYVRRINLKLEYDSQLNKDEVDEELIVRLYQYRIINRDKMSSYFNHGKYNDKGYEINEKEYQVIGKLLDTDDGPDNQKERELLQQYKIHGISKITEKERDSKRKQNKILIQGFPGGQFADRKLFDDIGKIDLNTMDLRNAAGHISEFREEFIKAITPGDEGKLKFSIGILGKKSHGGHVLLDIKFTPKVKGAYADMQTKTYSKSGSQKLIPTNIRPEVYLDRENKRTGKKQRQHSLSERGGQTMWYEGIPNAITFLFYLKKQLQRLQKMVMPHV